MKKKIHCLNPRMLVHPNAPKYIALLGSVDLNGRIIHLNKQMKSNTLYDFNFSDWSPYRNKIKYEDLDNYTAFDKSTGEFKQIYITVPCGKCIICRNKKANEWANRALAETKYSTNIPYFLTLDYNPLNLPPNGVEKKDLQNFLKRLRINLEREGIKQNIRYFATSEYGTRNTYRPHYHIIIWNMPNIIYPKLKRIITQSWSKRISKTYYDTLNQHHRYEYKYLKNDKTKTLYYERKGFTVLKPMSEMKGGVQYLMKYLRKPQTIIGDRNKPFILSSRRNGGIGHQWTAAYKQLYRDNPQIQTATFSHPFSGQIIKTGIPRYYRNNIFPSLATILGNKLSKAFSYLPHIVSKLEHISQLPLGYRDLIENRTHHYLDYEVILSKYDILNQPHTIITPTYFIKHFSKLNKKSQYDEVKRLISQYDAHISTLYQTDIDVNYVNYLLNIRELNQHYLRQYMDSFEDRDPQETAHKLERQQIRLVRAGKL